MLDSQVTQEDTNNWPPAMAASSLKLQLWDPQHPPLNALASPGGCTAAPEHGPEDEDILIRIGRVVLSF